MPDEIIAPPTGGTTPPPSGETPPSTTPPSGETPPPSGSTPPPSGETPPPSGSPPPSGEVPPPVDWRTREAAGDPARLKMLERYASEDAWKKSWFDLRKTVDTTRPKAPLPDNATPEQLAAWRADNGIPLEPAGYFEKLPDGLVIGADDKPLFDSFAAELHAANLPPIAAHTAIKWYNDFAEKQAAMIATLDAENLERTQAELRAEYGRDYDAHLNKHEAFLEALPADLKDRFLGARAQDGTLLYQTPEMYRWMLGIALQDDPMSSIPPGSGIGQGGKTAEDRIAEIRPLMANDSSAYWKGPKGADGKTDLEREYLQLQDFISNRAKRG